MGKAYNVRERIGNAHPEFPRTKLRISSLEAGDPDKQALVTPDGKMYVFDNQGEIWSEQSPVKTSRDGSGVHYEYLYGTKLTWESQNKVRIKGRLGGDDISTQVWYHPRRQVLSDTGRQY